MRSGPTRPNDRYVSWTSVTTSGVPDACRNAASAAASTTEPTTPPCSAPIEFIAHSRTGSSTTPRAASTVSMPTRSNSGASSPDAASAIVDGPAGRVAAMSGFSARRGSTEKLIVANPIGSSATAQVDFEHDRRAPRAQHLGAGLDDTFGRGRGQVQREVGRGDPVRLRRRRGEAAADHVDERSSARPPAPRRRRRTARARPGATRATRSRRPSGRTTAAGRAAGGDRADRPS